MAGSTAQYFGGDARAPRFGRMETNARQRLERVERLSWLLDRAIPIGRWRIGLDPMLGLLPGVGDWIAAVLSVYVLYEGARSGVPGWVLARMTLNVLVDTVVGEIPVLGDLFDFAWQSNARNVALMRKHHRPDAPPRSMAWVWAVVLLVAVVVFGTIAVLAYFFLKGVLELFHVEHIFG
jgi:hypothetical protein